MSYAIVGYRIHESGIDVVCLYESKNPNASLKKKVVENVLGEDDMQKKLFMICRRNYSFLG